MMMYTNDANFFFSVSADIENIDDGLESLCLRVTEHALSGEWLPGNTSEVRSKQLFEAFATSSALS